MQEELGKFEEFGAKIAVIIRNDAKNVKKYWQKNKLSFIGIPDEDKKIGELYKQQWKAFRLGLMPALFVIDQKGVIRFTHYSDGMSDIPENTQVFETLKGLKATEKSKGNTTQIQPSAKSAPKKDLKNAKENPTKKTEKKQENSH